jgi:hypothetical protein
MKRTLEYVPVIYKVETETTGKNKGREYIIRTDLFNEDPKKCFRKRGKGFHDYEKGIDIN